MTGLLLQLKDFGARRKFLEEKLSPLEKKFSVEKFLHLSMYNQNDQCDVGIILSPPPPQPQYPLGFLNPKDLNSPGPVAVAHKGDL